LNSKIFLPGTDKQLSLFLNSINPEKNSILIIGSGSEEVARIFYRNKAEVFLIVEDEEALVHSRFALSGEKGIKVRLMDFDNTDFNADKFDIVYSQGSTGTKLRNKIVREIIRVLKPDGFLCIGEIVSLAETPPKFVKDIWERSNLSPIAKNSFKDFLISKGFKLVLEQDLTETLKDFYSTAKILIQESSKDFPEKEAKYLMKISKAYSHEANAYLNLGGDKYIGYKMLVLKLISKLKSQISK
jgi:SAM-dependent methyltransferase